MSLQGHWLCYAPQAPADPQRHVVTSRMNPALSWAVTALFRRHAQETLSRVPQPASPVWQYVCPGNEGPAFLTRTSQRTRDGTSAAVVWGLVLPPGLLASPRFALQPCIGLFPGDDDPVAAWPATVEFTTLPAPPPGNELTQQLAAAYLEVEPLRIPSPRRPAETLLCQLVELLPPADRLQVSFATASLGLRLIEVDPDMPRDGGPTASATGLARVWLWDRLRPLQESTGAAVSLHQDVDVWLARLLQGPNLPLCAVSALQMLGGDGVSADLQDQAITRVRAALEQALRALAARRSPAAASTLDALCHAGLLARPALFPPLWAIRMVVQLQLLRSLSVDTLTQLLRPEAAPMLLGPPQGPVVRRTTDLVAGLAHASPAVNRDLLGTAVGHLRELRAQPERLRNDAGLSAAVALLAMYFNGRTEVSGAQHPPDPVGGG